MLYTQIKYMQPMPKKLGKILSNYDKNLVPEMNNGQLIKLIRDRYLVDAKPLVGRGCHLRLKN